MKTNIVLFLLLFGFSFCQGQNKGIITCGNGSPKAGVENMYFYEPPVNLLMPDKIEAVVICLNKQQLYQKTIDINKIDGKYQFLFKAPDSASVIILKILDALVNLRDYSALLDFQKKLVDNNNGNGFIIYLDDKNGKRFANEKIILAELLHNYSHYLDIHYTIAFISGLYKEGYRLHPELKNADSYSDYLTLLYEEKGDAIKPELVEYAKKMEEIQQDETKWLNAVGIYELLKMDEEKQQLENKILYAFPNGKFGKKIFWSNFYKNAQSNTQESILDSLHVYASRFKDSSYKVKDIFYSQILYLFIEQEKWNELSKYELLIHDKFLVEFTYNRVAWKLSGGKPGKQGNDLVSAEMLSKKSLQYIDERANDTLEDQSKRNNWIGAHNKYINTYALILYNLGNYDSAFYFQDAIYQRGNELNTEGLERYAVYAEKVKGAHYAKQVLEQQLLSGVNSNLMLQQLQAIYKQLNLPEDGFKQLQNEYTLHKKQKTSEEISSKLGTPKAPTFVLKNILGEQVSLFSFRGKVVVLDFWATWCGPCLASFPAMQEAIEKYKEDSGVVFLFIDVWEHKLAERMQKSTAAFMKNLNYNFNVLLDVDDKVVADYKIVGIPAKFVIDKMGEIVFMGETANIEVEIENAKQ